MSNKNPFIFWLEKQKDRDDEIGELATDFINDKKKPPDLNYEKLRGHIRHFIHDTNHSVEALDMAWFEYNGVRYVPYKEEIKLD